MDIKLDSQGDIDISSGGFELVDGDDGVVQEIIIRFQGVQGDWMLDLSEGLPLFSRILIASPNQADVYEIFRAEAKKVSGVSSVGREVSIDDISDEGALSVSMTYRTLNAPNTPQQLNIELGI